MKLGVKIASLNIFIVTGLDILIGTTIRRVVTSSLRTELTGQGESIAGNLSNRIADFILLDDFYKIQEAIEDVIASEQDIEYIYVTDKNGCLFAHTFKKGSPPALMHWNLMDINKLLSIQLLNTEKGFIRDIGIRVFGGINPELYIGIGENRITQTLRQIRNMDFILGNLRRARYLFQAE